MLWLKSIIYSMWHRSSFNTLWSFRKKKKKIFVEKRFTYKWAHWIFVNDAILVVSAWDHRIVYIAYNLFETDLYGKIGFDDKNMQICKWERERERGIIFVSLALGSVSVTNSLLLCIYGSVFIIDGLLTIIQHLALTWKYPELCRFLCLSLSLRLYFLCHSIPFLRYSSDHFYQFSPNYGFLKKTIFKDQVSFNFPSTSSSYKLLLSRLAGLNEDYD